MGAEFQKIGLNAEKILDRNTGPFFSENFGSQCSATYITNDGYFLLALHCLRDCLAYGGTQNNINYSALEHENIGDNNWVTRINFKKAKALTCGLNSILAKVISLGAKGYLSERTYFKLAKENPNTLETLLQNGFDGIAASGDFALMKIHGETLTKQNLNKSGHMKRPGECLQVAERNAKTNDPIWSLSFPSLRRKKMRKTYEPLITAGTVIPRNILQGYTTEMFRFEQDATSLDAESGSSGASYFDKEGKIRGIVVSTANPIDSYGYGTTIGIQIEHILKSIKNDLSNELYEKIISGCTVSENTKSLIDELTRLKDPPR